ncbi:hypothetical protein GGP89_003118 [Salinibacter ruber]|uniref:Uncharacterized protein n=1 Tax=Salinibacter ruber TaxID=146919 RepID=A0A9X2U4D1_9BACT|nr:hypothetical protein [Salinibacter ruber]MCS3866567.1 hypothetical protein [Salinibacter ruber]
MPARLIPGRGESAARQVRRREAVALSEKSRSRKTVSTTRDHDFGLVNVLYHVLYHWTEGEEEPRRLVTNLSTGFRVARLHRRRNKRRMWIEELFRGWPEGTVPSAPAAALRPGEAISPPAGTEPDGTEPRVRLACVGGQLHRRGEGGAPSSAGPTVEPPAPSGSDGPTDVSGIENRLRCACSRTSANCPVANF